MKAIRLLLLVAALAAGGCRQGTSAGSAARPPSPDDVIGKYAQERGISREQAAVSIRKELDAARAAGVSSPSGFQSPGTGFR